MREPTILVPYRAGGLLYFRVDDQLQVLDLWIEVCLDPTAHIWRFEGTLVDAEQNLWVATIPSTFTVDRYDQEYSLMVCVQTADTPADVLAMLPVNFGIYADYEPDTYTLTKQVNGEIALTVNRVVVPAGVSSAMHLIADAPISLGYLVRQTLTGAALYDSLNANHAYSLTGVSISSASAGESLAVQSAGLVTIPGWGLTPDAVYYAGAAGTLVLNPDANGAFIQPIGRALDANRFQFAPDEILFTS